MKILVTGGLGYIGSHTVVELQHSGYDVIIIDNLSNTSVSVLKGIEAITGKMPVFEELDLRNKSRVTDFFARHKTIDGVIHFAAFKAVGESVENPLLYYENNVGALVYLLRELIQRTPCNFIFSSSCTVYGEAAQFPVTENSPWQRPESPYGSTKQMSEDILRDVCRAHSTFKTISLRYFNPIGAHESVKIGESPTGIPQNLVPFITQTAVGLREQLLVFGGDYPTKDGTCIRDYIHIADVAKAHVTALKRLLNDEQHSNYEAFNLGSGEGTSVLEIIRRFEKISGKELNYKITERRKGDVAIAYAATEKANEVLGWKAQHTLDDALQSAWEWEQKIRKKITSK